MSEPNGMPLEALDEYFAQPPICEPKDNVRWLEQRGPDPALWYHTALNWNWDVGVDVLHWIIRQPQCDGAIASWVLLFGGDSRMMDWQSGTGETALFALFSEIAEKWRAGFYEVRKAGFDTQRELSFRKSCRKHRRAFEEYNSPPLWELPNAAFGPFSGPVPPVPNDVVFEEGRLRMQMKRWYEEVYLRRSGGCS